MNSFVPLPLHPLSLVLDHVRAWPTQSQQGARRNAMIATTALAARRAEREDVEDFFAALKRSTSHPQLPLVLHR
jgi:hypothetical protein